MGPTGPPPGPGLAGPPGLGRAGPGRDGRARARARGMDRGRAGRQRRRNVRRLQTIIVEPKTQCVKYWEIIADNLSRAGWSWGCVSAVDSCGRTIWIADAHRGDGKRFVVRADEKLTAFVELERITFDDDQLERFRGARRRACFPAE